MRAIPRDVMPLRPPFGTLAAAAFLLAGTLLFFASAAALPAGEVLTRTVYEKAANSVVQIERVFEGGSQRGFEPVNVRIQNRTTRPRTWTLNFNYNSGVSKQYSSTFTVEAEANQEAVASLLVPSPTSNNSWRNLSVQVSSPGLGQKGGSLSSHSNRDWPSLAMSEALATRNLAALTKEMEKQRSGHYGNERFAASFNPKELPGDWRGYTGFDAFIITVDEWQGLLPLVRQAILEWNRLGGILIFYHEEDGATPSIEALVGNPGKQRSLGGIRLVKWDGETLKPTPTVASVQSIENRGARVIEDYRRNWPLSQEFGDASFNTFLVILLLVAFGVIVGPVNLFVLAKPGRRHRLFITTPVISVVTSILIALLILFGEGVGGSGIRHAFIDLEAGSEENKAYVIQEQMSRTGVLLGGAFELSEAAVVSPLRLPDSRWNQMLIHNELAANVRVKEQTYRGNWFQSRAEQGQYLETVRPTRWRVELSRPSDGDTPPALFSSVDFTLDAFYYIDSEGRRWKATNTPIESGQEIELEAATGKAFKDWWEDEVEPFSLNLRRGINALNGRRNHFFARTRDPRAGFIETHEAIRWEDQRAVVYGAVSNPAG